MHIVANPVIFLIPHRIDCWSNGKGSTPDAHLDMLVEADISLGLLIQELKRQGSWKIPILFTSDNGETCPWNNWKITNWSQFK